jgi:hypothetical protein
MCREGRAIILKEEEECGERNIKVFIFELYLNKNK